MRLERVDHHQTKGWFFGPWNSDLALSVGYATAAVDEPHLHRRLTEIYLIAQGTSTIRLEQDTIALHAGDLLAIEPGEAHTVLASSPEYLHFVIHTPAPVDPFAQPDKVLVPRERLGL